MIMKVLIGLMLAAMPVLAWSSSIENGYHPISSEGKVWNYTYHAQGGDQKMSIEVKGDTVIDKNNCYKLYLCTPNDRYLYGCYFEGENGEVYAFITLDIQKENGRLTMHPLETARPAEALYQFQSQRGFWTPTWGNEQIIYLMSVIAINRSARYPKTSTPFQISPAQYELINVDDSYFARAQLTDLQQHDTLETWVSGVGEREWGIMQPIQGIGKNEGGEWIEFESCEENGRRLFSKADFDVESLEQNYHPFVEDNKTWTCSTNTYGAGIYYYHLKGDTLVDNQKCLKLFSQNRYNNGATCYEGALFEKDQKVFLYKSGSTQRSLLYDFSLKQGEKAMLYGYHPHNKPEQTDSFGVRAVTEAYELHDGKLLRITFFYEFYQYGDGKTDYGSHLGNWIEGVGPGRMMDVLFNTGFNIKGDGYGSGIIDCSVNGKKCQSNPRRWDCFRMMKTQVSMERISMKSTRIRWLAMLSIRRCFAIMCSSVYVFERAATRCGC